MEADTLGLSIPDAETALEPLVDPDTEEEPTAEREGLGVAEAVLEREGEPEAVNVRAEVRDCKAEVLGGNVACADALGGGERLPVSLPVVHTLAAGERLAEVLAASDALLFVLPLGTLVRLLEALSALLADTESVVLPLALRHALAVFEIEGGREALCVMVLPPLGVAGLVRLTVGLSAAEPVAEAEAVPFAAEPVTLAVTKPVLECVAVEAAESETHCVGVTEREAMELAHALLLEDGVPPKCEALGNAVCEGQELAIADAVAAEAEPLKVPAVLCVAEFEPLSEIVAMLLVEATGVIEKERELVADADAHSEAEAEAVAAADADGQVEVEGEDSKDAVGRGEAEKDSVGDEEGDTAAGLAVAPPLPDSAPEALLVVHTEAVTTAGLRDTVGDRVKAADEAMGDAEAEAVESAFGEPVAEPLNCALWLAGCEPLMHPVFEEVKAAENVALALPAVEAVGKMESVALVLADFEADDEGERVGVRLPQVLAEDTRELLGAPVTEKCAEALTHDDFEAVEAAESVRLTLADLEAVEAADSVRLTLADLEAVEAAESVRLTLADLEAVATAESVALVLTDLEAEDAGDRVGVPLSHALEEDTSEALDAPVAEKHAELLFLAEIDTVGDTEGEALTLGDFEADISGERVGV